MPVAFAHTEDFVFGSATTLPSISTNAGHTFNKDVKEVTLCPINRVPVNFDKT